MSGFHALFSIGGFAGAGGATVLLSSGGGGHRPTPRSGVLTPPRPPRQGARPEHRGREPRDPRVHTRGRQPVRASNSYRVRARASDRLSARPCERRRARPPKAAGLAADTPERLGSAPRAGARRPRPSRGRSRSGIPRQSPRAPCGADRPPAGAPSLRARGRRRGRAGRRVFASSLPVRSGGSVCRLPRPRPTRRAGGCLGSSSSSFMCIPIAAAARIGPGFGSRESGLAAGPTPGRSARRRGNLDSASKTAAPAG